MEYDAMNRIIKTKVRGQDENGNIVSIVNQVNYDSMGNVKEETDAKGIKTQYIYNQKNLLEKNCTRP